ncbi:hypothetical protein QT602_22670, partial [Xanthomonas citri pv. citri]
TSTMVETQLTVVLLDGVWRRETTTHHDPRTDAGSGLDYPHDYPHDYGGMSILDTVANTSGMPQPIRLTSRSSAHASTRTSSSAPTGTRSTRPFRPAADSKSTAPLTPGPSS